jgi:protoheme IX farnesyltransferase
LSQVSLLFQLTKPTICLLVMVTTLPGVFLASEQLPGFWTCCVAVLGAGLASAAAAVFNQVIEVDTDKLMERTKHRPLPTGKLSKNVALFFGVFLGCMGFVLLWNYTQPLAAWISLAGVFYYVVIYTILLKPRTVQNTLIGGAAGAVGPLIGWSSVSGDLSILSWLLFLLITLWTPPHFWSLAIKYTGDYAKANFPMYPVVFGEMKTRKVIFLYSLPLIPCLLGVYYFYNGSVLWVLISSFLTLRFVYDAYSVFVRPAVVNAMSFFYYSCVYAFAIFGLLAMDKLWSLIFRI